MTQTVWTVTRVAHAVIIRGCCGLPDEDPAGGPTCNCKPTECDCTSPEGVTHG
jgi:hypothetical protein